MHALCFSFVLSISNPVWLKVAHALAKIGVGLNCDVVWMEDYPSSINDLVIADVST